MPSKANVTTAGKGADSETASKIKRAENLFDRGKQKGRTVSGPLLLQLPQLGKDSAAKATTDLRQFYKRKFLNFNNGFNDCRIHSNPPLREVERIATKATLLRSFGESEHALSRG